MPNWLKRITPVLLVDEIESCIPFWEALGFDKTVDVMHEGRLGFVILEKSGLEIMYQTRASIAADLPALADAPGGGTFLFLEVMNLDQTIEAVEGAPIVFPRRNAITFAMAVSD
jgi:hypothetical protein